MPTTSSFYRSTRLRILDCSLRTESSMCGYGFRVIETDWHRLGELVAFSTRILCIYWAELIPHFSIRWLTLLLQSGWTANPFTSLISTLLPPDPQSSISATGVNARYLIIVINWLPNGLSRGMVRSWPGSILFETPSPPGMLPSLELMVSIL